MTVRAQLLVFLAATFGTSLAAGFRDTRDCDQFVQECNAEFLACIGEPACIEAFLCIVGCGEEDVECSYICSMSALSNSEFADLMQCSADTG